MRVLLVGLSNMMMSIIASALNDTPIEVIPDRTGSPDDIVLKVQSTQADAVIMQDDLTGAPDSILRLLKSFPLLKVVTINKDGRAGLLRELRLYTLNIDEISAEVIERVLLDDTHSLSS